MIVLYDLLKEPKFPQSVYRLSASILVRPCGLRQFCQWLIATSYVPERDEVSSSIKKCVKVVYVAQSVLKRPY